MTYNVTTPRPGDMAHHVRGYDPRPVLRVTERSIYIDVLGASTGPCPRGNYTFTRAGMAPERIAYLRGELEAGTIDLAELDEIDEAFDLLDPAALAADDDPENATAADKLDELEHAAS